MYQNKTEIKFEIAGIPFSVICHNPEPIAWLREAYDAFLSEKPLEMNIFLQIKKNVRVTLPKGYSSEVAWHDRSFSLKLDHLRAEGDLSAGQIMLQATQGFGLGNLFRCLFSILLVKKGGFLLHASALVDKGRSYVFCGPSQSGKTTIARLGLGQDILTDETVALRKRDGFYYTYATPFFGEMGKVTRNHRARTKAIFFIHKKDHFSHRKLSHKEAIKQIFPNIIFLGKEHPEIEDLFDILAEATKSIPCYDLYFRPDSSLWSYIRGIT